MICLFIFCKNICLYFTQINGSLNMTSSTFGYNIILEKSGKIRNININDTYRNVKALALDPTDRPLNTVRSLSLRLNNKYAYSEMCVLEISTNGKITCTKYDGYNNQEIGTTPDDSDCIVGQISYLVS